MRYTSHWQYVYNNSCRTFVIQRITCTYTYLTQPVIQPVAALGKIFWGALNAWHQNLFCFYHFFFKEIFVLITECSAKKIDRLLLKCSDSEGINLAVMYRASHESPMLVTEVPCSCEESLIFWHLPNDKWKHDHQVIRPWEFS